MRQVDVHADGVAVPVQQRNDGKRMVSSRAGESRHHPAGLIPLAPTNGRRKIQSRREVPSDALWPACWLDRLDALVTRPPCWI